MKKDILLYGIIGGVLIAVLKLIEYRYLIATHSFEIYGGLVAVIFAAMGIWLGLKLTKTKVVVQEVRVPETPFVRDQAAADAIGLTAREVEILELIAAGLSNRQIAEKLFVSENTVKTHSSRVFAKLNANRRTQAVQIAKQQRIIP